jgi:hypothetical protein
MVNHENPPSTLIRCIFVGNVADLTGGGLSNDDANDTTLTNCTFIGNCAGAVGGGMWSESGHPTLTNCTFVGNYANVGGGGVCGGYPALVNCVLWDGGNEIWNNDGSTITITYSDVQGGWPGEGNIDADPLFETDGWHLRMRSPCRNAGDPSFVPDSDETDMDGQPRVLDGRVDIGADEVALEFETPEAGESMEGGDPIPS